MRIAGVGSLDDFGQVIPTVAIGIDIVGISAEQFLHFVV